MKTFIKIACVMVLVLIVSFPGASESFAIGKQDVKIKVEIENVITDVLKASNSHDEEALTKFYSNNYVSGDNLSIKEYLEMIKKTWETYPDISYQSDVTTIRYSDNWASIESHDSATGTTAKISDITDDKGNMNSKSHSITYLRKIGKEWKIVGDFTYYEKSIVQFGSAKGLDIKFSSPEQVRAGQMFSAKIAMEIPVGSFVVGSITKEPVVYPPINAKEKFRTINQNEDSLERVFEANEGGVNESVTATIGITELTEDNQARPTVKLQGICIISNRVNVLPESNFDRKEFILTYKENIETGAEDIIEPEVQESPGNEDM